MNSIWRNEVGHLEKSHKEISEDDFYDVIVIGAGLCGILTAYYLQNKGKNVLVLEAAKIASGQTERTTAKITSQYGLKYSELISKVGMKKALLYAKANEDAIKEYERLIKTNNISCDFNMVSSFLYSTEDETCLKNELDSAQSLGINACYHNNLNLPFEIKGAVEFPNQAQFSPLKFVSHIIKELSIIENSRVLKVKKTSVFTETKEFKAHNIVIATHYPFINAPGFYFFRQHQERSYVYAISGDNVKSINNLYYSIDKEGLSLRREGDVLLIGGASHRTGHNKCGGAYEYLESMAKKYFPDCKLEAKWSAQDCMPHDKIPFIGKYSLFTPNMYVATGFQKWGMTTSMIGAKLLTDMICGRKNDYSELFSPQRINFKAGFKDLIMDVGVSVSGLTKGIFHLPIKTHKDLERGDGGIIRYGFKRKACFKDDNGNLHLMSAKCPHLGCELTWNPDEKSFDCPCHGSRFDVNGRLLDNPSFKDVKNIENDM